LSWEFPLAGLSHGILLVLERVALKKAAHVPRTCIITSVLPQKPSIPAIDNFIPINHFPRTRRADQEYYALRQGDTYDNYAWWIIWVQHLQCFTQPSLPPPPTAALPLLRSRPKSALSQYPQRRSRNEINRLCLVKSVLKGKQRSVKRNQIYI